MLCVRRSMDHMKKYHEQNLFILNFTKVSENSVQVGPLVTCMKNVEENVCSILYIIHSKSMTWQYWHVYLSWAKDMNWFHSFCKSFYQRTVLSENLRVCLSVCLSVSHNLLYWYRNLYNGCRKFSKIPLDSA